MSCKNSADISFNPKNSFEENEAKLHFMKSKSQNVRFFKPIPHFDCESSNEIGECRFENVDSCPTKKANFFNDVNDSFNKEKKFNSYLFQDK